MSDYIRQAQILLKKAGTYKGIVDGVFGKESLKAVRKLIGSKNTESPEAEVIKPKFNEPAWVEEARKHIGLKEIKGPSHEPKIMRWIKKLGGWFTTDEVPWCGTFIAQCLYEANRAVPRLWYRAKAYTKYGTKLKKPAYGCIGVMSRKGGGHVTFIVGQTADGRYLVGLGGNQSNKVNLMKFPRSRFTAWVWPSYKNGVESSPYTDRYKLPIYSNDLKVSTSEA